MIENNNKVIKVLLIEDEESDIAGITEYIDSVDDLELVGVTNDSNKGVLLTKEKQPHIVILDLELTWGYGSGLLYLKNLMEFRPTVRPTIIVTTKIHDDYTWDAARDLGANFVLYKRQAGYKPEYIITTARMILRTSRLSQAQIPAKAEFPKSKEDRIARMQRWIKDEFHHLGLGAHLKGYYYLVDAICTVALAEDDNPKSFRQLVFPPMVKKYKKSIENIQRNMINAIDRTWRLMEPEVLAKRYTQQINREIGAPTVSEFVYFYADKIKSEVP